EPPRSILTWEDLVSKFINEFFPPSRTINLRNEISNFQQQFDESFHQAWDRYKDLIRACPHHGFTELHQLDTFYNALNPADQDSLNSAAGGNLLERRTQDVLTIIENKSKVRNSQKKSIVSQAKSSDTNSSSSSEIAKLAHAVNQQTSAVTTAMTAILKQFQATPPPASVKAIEDNIQGYVAAPAVNYNQGNSSYRPPGAANRWLEKEPPYSILTWEDLVSKFINEFFPPSRTTNLRNEISNFQQRFDESFHEAWDRYKDLLRACPHHGFTELHQLDTFYDAINLADQDSLNSAAGGNLLERRAQDVLTIIENKSKIAKLTHAVNQQTSAVTTAMTAILKQFQATPPPASVKAIE
nr:reverse transcriptase domain-containing protein [Tanacetum cinerariifolium]